MLHCTSIDLNQSPELSSTVPDDEIEDQASRDSVRTINGPGCDTQVNDTNGALDNEDKPESPSLIRNGSPNLENVNMLELPSPAQKPESSSLMERTGSPSLLSKFFLTVIFLSFIFQNSVAHQLYVCFSFYVKITQHVYNFHSINNR